MYPPTLRTVVRPASQDDQHRQSEADSHDQGTELPEIKGSAICSPHCRCLSLGDQTIVYNTLRGRALIGSSDIGDVVQLFESERRIVDVALELGVAEAELMEILQPFFAKSILIDPGLDERQHMRLRHKQHIEKIEREDEIGTVGLMMTSACNFDCPYCVSRISNANRPESGRQTGMMSIETAHTVVDTILVRVRELGQDKVNIGFCGGEPLLNWKVIHDLLRYIEESYPDITPSYGCNTNLSLVTEEIASAVKQYRVEISPSLDGSQVANDAVRFYRAGRGTFDDIVRGLSRLRDCGVEVSAVSTTVVDDNFDLLDRSMIECMAELGLTNVRLEPDMVTEINRPIDEIVDKLVYLRDEGRKQGIRVDGWWSLPYRRITDPDKFGVDAPVSCGAVRGTGYAVDPSGMVRLCGYARDEMCHISEWMQLRRSAKHIERLRQRWLPEITVCHGCSVEGLCKGGCFVSYESCQLKRDDRHDPGCPSKASTSSCRQPTPLGFRCELYRQVTDRMLSDKLESMQSTAS